MYTSPPSTSAEQPRAVRVIFRRTHREHKSYSSPLLKCLSSSPFRLLLNIFALCAVAVATKEIQFESSVITGLRRSYTNEWAIRIAGGREEEANEMAAKYGFDNLGREAKRTRAKNAMCGYIGDQY